MSLVFTPASNLISAYLCIPSFLWLKSLTMKRIRADSIFGQIWPKSSKWTLVNRVIIRSHGSQWVFAHLSDTLHCLGGIRGKILNYGLKLQFVLTHFQSLCVFLGDPGYVEKVVIYLK